MSDDVEVGLDGMAEIKGEEPGGYRCASTPETRARWQFLSTQLADLAGPTLHAGPVCAV